ncbi:MAG: protein kinase domain-containing protein [Planctomycetota bacterium]|jgi:serine/threonine protein kinase
MPSQAGDGPGSPPSPEAIAAYFPHLEIIEILGWGGMGVVYKARQKNLDRLVALKILPPDPDRPPGFAERFGREAQAMAKLHHAHIVMVHDSGEAGGLYYFIMEFVDGANLRDVMRGGRIEPGRALSLIPQICDALQYAHDEGVMHRDIKPENILLDRRGRVKIADFGLAKLLVHKATDIGLTAPQQVMGTMHYMAPEQVERPTEVDHRADIYALGVLLYELLTGELPIGRFPLPSERISCDPRIDDLVVHALEKDPDRRFQQVNDVRAVVASISALHEPSAAPSRVRSSEVLPSRGGTPPVTPSSHAHLPQGARLAAIPPPDRSVGLAYALWCLCFVGVFGAHRIYAGKYVTGVLWMLTLGCLLVGQFVDLFLVPRMLKMRTVYALMRAQAVEYDGDPRDGGTTKA